MANKMLIDASHPEETRVVVVRGNRVEEFDFEAATRKQLRGNIYLAKVTRVEPSLQAAFVDYGGNRHGFLAFSEIHPDYYQIPVADRMALLEEEARVQAAEAERSAGEETRAPKKTSEEAESEEDQVESVGAGDALEEVPERRAAPKFRRQYKIQEVIRRRQILLVQVVKEERGTKGAALTTYLSLAGRYSVLMPNTPRGGGISRKITDPTDRKRLKKIAQELDVPEGMGVILRTAGAARTKTEIKRDFEYLLRLWETVRDLTLKSTAPKLVYEEGSLIKRSIRDLYNRDIDEVLVQGEEAYREAKDFMRMLMPSHAKNVKPYRDPTPIFTRFGVESQLDAMFSPIVRLRSGGYVVINQAEALVAIDVNSGKATREHHIEDTALQTNLEAADEVARQLRLRDLAGLIVIDFIDMEEKRNNRAVERKLKECLKNDRARIQVGRISHFGLMEMSRQRIRTGVLESSMVVCPHCGGTGSVRSTESVALHVLRALEEGLLRGVTHDLEVRTRTPVALYILNQKRAHVMELERRFGLSLSFIADDSAAAGGHLFLIERREPVSRPPTPIETHVQPSSVEMADEADMDEEELAATEAADASPGPNGADAEEGEEGAARRRRRRRRRGRGPEDVLRAGASADLASNGDAAGAEESDEEAEAVEEAGAEGSGEEAEETVSEAQSEAESGERRRRRRGRRGGRRPRRDGEALSRPEIEGDEEFGQAEPGPPHVEAGAPELTVEPAAELSPDDPGSPMRIALAHISIAPDADAGTAESGAPIAGAFAQIAVIRDDEDRRASDAAAVKSEDESEPATPGASGTEHVSASNGGYPHGAEPGSDAPESGTVAAPAALQPAADETEAAEREARIAPFRHVEPTPPPLPEPEEDPNRPKRSGWWSRRNFF